jgi:hypothetical protein
MSRASRKKPTFPAPPTKPDPAECCDRGCDPCIFDYYDRALERWKAKVRQMGGKPDELLGG